MIKKYKKKNGETAYKLVAYLGVDPMTGKQVRTTRQGFKTEREAKRAEMQLIEQYERQGFWKKNDITTFDEVAQLWFELYQNTVKESTYFTNKEYYKNNIQPYLGQCNITKITVMTCQKMTNALASKSAYTIYLSIANRIFKYAMHMGMIESNPMDKVIRPKCTHIPRRETIENYYTKEELNQFLELVKEHCSLEELIIYRILAFGGLRIGEALALEDGDFDFDDPAIDVSKTIARTQQGLVIQNPKTKRSKRRVPIDHETIRLVRQYIQTLPTPLHGSFRLFHITGESVRGRLKTFLKRHNLKKITPHGFRHTHASLLFAAGIPAKVAQERLGHAKISITLDLYTHLSKTQKDDVIDRLSDYLAG